MMLLPLLFAVIALTVNSAPPTVVASLSPCSRTPADPATTSSLLLPVSVVVDGWSSWPSRRWQSVVIDSSRPTFSWLLTEEENEADAADAGHHHGHHPDAPVAVNLTITPSPPTLLRRRSISQTAYTIQLQLLQPLAIARRAVTLMRDASTVLPSSPAEDWCSSPSSCSCAWDSGLVLSSASHHIPYAGQSLRSDASYQWCISYHSSSGAVSNWSCGVFRTAICLSDTSSPTLSIAGSPASWIGSADELFPINELRRDFKLPSFTWPTLSELETRFSTSRSAFPVQAVATVSGVGNYQLYVNGQRIDPSRQLDPTWTTYERRLYYASFDVVSLLQSGGNCIAAMLGGGWFNRGMHFAWQLPKPNYGLPRLILSLNISWSDQTSTVIVSDSSWQGRQGAVQFDHVYHGQVTDARLVRPGWANFSFTDSRSLWKAVDEVASPGGEMQLMPVDPIRSGKDNLHVKVQPQLMLQPPGVIGAPVVLPDGLIAAANVTQPIRSVYVFDLGQNYAGWVQICMKGLPGWPVVVRYGEMLLTLPADMSTHVFQANFRGATQSDLYLMRGDGAGQQDECFIPSTFSQHGFRYVSIFRPYQEGMVATQVTGIPLHTETALIGQFVSSSRILNQIQHNIQWGMLSQAMGIFTDCPSRDERMGWMDDLLLTSDQGLYVSIAAAVLARNSNATDDGSPALLLLLCAVLAVVPACRTSISFSSTPPSSRRWTTDSETTATTTTPRQSCWTRTRIPTSATTARTRHRSADVSSVLTADTICDCCLLLQWSSAPVILAWKLYKHALDAAVLAAHYDNHERLLLYWYALYNSTGLRHMPGSYGDWAPPAPYAPISPELPSAFIFMVDVLTFINISAVLNKTQQLHHYTQLYQRLAPEFHSAFYDNSSNCYYGPDCPQAAQVLALDLPAVVPQSLQQTVMANLVSSINRTGCYTGGETSYARLWYVLSDNGQHDLALSLALATNYPSLGYQFVNDIPVYATTLWESFLGYEGGMPGMNSMNHVMFSTVGQWYYERLAGIEMTARPQQPLSIHPRLPFQHDLLWEVRAEHVSLYGSVQVNWTIHSPLLEPSSTDWMLELSLSIPANHAAVPVTFDPLSASGRYELLTEGSERVWSLTARENAVVSGIITISTAPLLSVMVSSGLYHFTAHWMPDAPSALPLAIFGNDN